jgi:hypothetical protein
MPRRKEATRAKRLNEQVLNSLREIVLSGKPWTRTGLDGIPGDGDVYGLISGHFFFPSYCSPEDEESQRVLWDELKEERSTAKSRASEFHRAYSDNAHRVGKLRMSSQRRSIST